MNDYEALRAANIKRNNELLASLGLDTPLKAHKPREQAKKAQAQSKKRKANVLAEGSEQPPKKMGKVAVDAGASATDATPSRRSTRNAGKPKINYSGSQSDEPNSVLVKSRTPQTATAVPLMGREHTGNRLGQRTNDPKTFGAIPGVKVGTWWETRAECSTEAVHAPFVAGIAGSATQGAYSVALSGGYDDDVDLGYAFTYTGSGGRDLKGTKNNPKNLRTAPQSSDQTFDNSMNAALKRSAETKRPIRVIRGFKLDSKYAPESGYRYDGLYTVEKAWIERGLNKQGYKVCKFAFKRMGGQPPLPTGNAAEDGDSASEGQGPHDAGSSEGEEAKDEE